VICGTSLWVLVMRYRRLGGWGLRVSEISLGSNNFGTQVDRPLAIRVIDRALELGVNMIDTANVYTGGKSEEIIGEALKGRRDEVVVATKVGSPVVSNNPIGGGLSRKHIMWQFKKSLQRLQTDYVDIYYLHRFDPETPLEETLRTMDYLVREGFVRYVGVSNFDVKQLEATWRTCEELGLEKPIVLQPPYNLLRRDIEVEVAPWCESHGMGVAVYSPLQGGLLTGKYSLGAQPPEGSRAAYNPIYRERWLTAENLQRVEKYREVAGQLGVDLRELAVAWILSHRWVSTAIVGASNPAQVDENVKALEVNIPQSLLEKLDNQR
jgi:aryl-alcohol dehydrogenase-like predicted oxidoreductase